MRLWRRVFRERRAVVLPLVAVVLVNVVVLALAVVPLKTMVSDDTSHSLTAAIALTQAKARLTQAQAARSSRDQAQDDLKKFYADVLPANFASARHVLYLEIDRIAGENGLIPDRQSWEPTPIKDSRLNRFDTEVTLVGEYGNIKRFLYDVETTEAFVVVESVSLAAASQKKGGSLQVTLHVTTYYQGGTQ